MSLKDAKSNTTALVSATKTRLPVTVYNYEQNVPSSVALSAKRKMVPGVDSSKLTTVAIMPGLRGGEKCHYEYHILQQFHPVVHTLDLDQQFLDRWDASKLPGTASGELPTTIVGLLGKRHLVSGLSLDGIEIVQMAHICRHQQAEIKSLTLVQPKTKEVTANLAEMKSKTEIHVAQYSGSSAPSYSSDLAGFAADGDKKDLALWLQASDWTSPTLFFYPSKPESIEEVLLALDTKRYSLVVVNHSNSWLTRLSATNPAAVAELFKKYQVKQTRAPGLGEKFTLCYFIFQKRT